MSANIYIIEDEEPIITLIKYNLEKEGYKVSYSDNGNDGIKEIKKKLPDLILLDWMLPDFSGVEICKNLKKDIPELKKAITSVSEANFEVNQITERNKKSGNNELEK